MEFAKAGVNVVLNYHRHALMAQRVAEKIKDKYDVDVLCVKADVAVEEEVEAMMNQVADHFGKIDILVNNAGICRDSLLLKSLLLTLEEF